MASKIAWRAQQRDLQERGTPFVLPGGALVPALAVAAMALIVATLTGREWTAIGVALVVLVMVYAMLHLRRRAR